MTAVTIGAAVISVLTATVSSAARAAAFRALLRVRW